MADVLVFDEEPIKVPFGPLDNGIRQKIENAVALNVPEDKHVAVLAMLDHQTGEPLKAQLGAAVRAGKNWKLTADAEHVFGGPSSAKLGIVGVF